MCHKRGHFYVAKQKAWKHSGPIQNWNVLTLLIDWTGFLKEADPESGHMLFSLGKHQLFSLFCFVLLQLVQTRPNQIPSETAVVEGQTLTIVKAMKKDAGTYTVLRYKRQAWALRTL